MPDQNNSTFTQFNQWTIRYRESQAPIQDSRLLLMIHGYTGDENSMWVFARDLPDHYWLLAPRAPEMAKDGGYTWRTIQTGTFGMPNLKGLLPSAEALIRLVDEYQASVGIDAKDFDVMGFSQGAVMSGVLAFHFPQRVRKLGLLAGFLPPELQEISGQRPLAGRKVFVAHGTKDETVPVSRAHESIHILESAGAKVEYCEDNVGHKISLPCMRALRNYLED